MHKQNEFDPVHHVHELVPFERTRMCRLREVGDISKSLGILSMQSNAVRAWLRNRQHDRGMRMKQRVSVGGCIFKRTARAEIIVETW